MESLIGWSFIVASFAVMAFIAWCLFIDDDSGDEDDDPEPSSPWYDASF